jgi:hypothetical protein
LNGTLHSSEVEELRVAHAAIRGFAARGEVVREKLSSRNAGFCSGPLLCC